MTSKIHGQHPAKLDRNWGIWLKRARGVSVADLAVEYGMSERRVYEIINQVTATIPDEDRDQLAKLRRTNLDAASALLTQVIDRGPKPAFAPNGRPLLDLDGNQVWDYSDVFAAVGLQIKVDERLGRLTGTDAPSMSLQAIQVTHREAAQQAAEESAARVTTTGVLARFSTLAAS